MAVGIKMAVSTDIALCSLVEVPDVSEILAVVSRTLKMEAARTSATSVNTYQPTRRNNQ
jgi:hypothetical protein